MQADKKIDHIRRLWPQWVIQFLEFVLMEELDEFQVLICKDIQFRNKIKSSRTAAPGADNILYHFILDDL